MYQELEGSRGEAVQPKGPALHGRRFVLLQGPSSRFFFHLGRALRAQGARVTRIGFCPGDRLYWAAPAGRYIPYRGRLDGFGAWLLDLLAEDKTTDILMLGDGRAPHAIALDALSYYSGEMQAWIVEHGYLRPNLILIEPDGMGGNSTIPERFLNEKSVPNASTPPNWPGSFLRYAMMDVAYHLSNVFLGPVLYPHYRAHSGIHPLREYSGWVLKSAKAPLRALARGAALKTISEHEGLLFIYPLQLSHDMQLHRYGTGEAQLETLDRVVESFLTHAPVTAGLVVKVHPLDNGLTNWRRRLAKAGPRIIYLDGGDLDALLLQCAGVVTINSTVGIASLRAGVPTLALGEAVYRAAGLTWEGELDDFWQGVAPPSAEHVQAFVDLLSSEFHVPGAFDGPGAPVGAREIANWLACHLGRAEVSAK